MAPKRVRPIDETEFARVYHEVEALAPGAPNPQPSMAPGIAKSGETSAASCEGNQDTPKDADEVPKTRRASLIESYGMQWATIVNAYISKEADIRTCQQCVCGKGMATTRCRDCFQLPPMCNACFLLAHKYTPFHWAESWNSDAGYFIRRDLSRLDDKWAVSLGHDGDPCPFAQESLLMNIVETNGVHATRIRYCYCNGRPSKWEQLFEANLFPGTVADPGTAYTFRVLREYQIHSETSKSQAYDYCRSLARLTDYRFSEAVPDYYTNFLTITRLWAFLRVNKWSGQGHGIDRWLPHRPPGDLGVYCPSCPEHGVNMEAGWADTPTELKHLHSCRRALDGNFQLNHFSKKHDPRDVSLYDGRSIFPKHSTEKKYIAEVPQLQRDARRVLAERGKGGKVDEVEAAERKELQRRHKEEKANCTYLNAIAKQEQKKFKGMDITGVVSVMCDHGITAAMVDLQVGERFANTDLALAHALTRHQFPEKEVPDQVLSYDSQCNYCVHLMERFTQWFPNLAYLIRDMRFTIPAMHVRNHLDMCMYLYAAAYKPNCGHFHGEGIEKGWAETNALGPAVRQMSNGHRQDVIIEMMYALNTHKVLNMGLQLEKDLIYAKRRYFQARDNLKGLYIIHASKMESWNGMDRSPRPDLKNKRLVHSVYAQTPSKALSFTQLIQKMMRSEKLVSCGDALVVQETVMARFLKEALFIQDAQVVIRRKMKGLRSEGRVADSKAVQDVEDHRLKLIRRIEKLRSNQGAVLPGMEDLVCTAKPCSPEDEILWLPSDVLAVDHVKLGLKEVAKKEGELRKAMAWDLILELQATVRMLTAAADYKVTHDRGQDQNTRSSTVLNRYKTKRQELLEDYNRHRSALLKLGELEGDSDEWPELHEKDTYRKSTTAKRGVGASRVNDGNLWRAGVGLVRESVTVSAAEISKPMREARNEAGGVMTEMSRRKGLQRDGSPTKGERPAKRVKHVESKDLESFKGEDGWIWRHGLDAGKVDEWAEEQERVKFFRDEAEMERWREQVEIKHAEFERCILTFGCMSQVWLEIARSAFRIQDDGGEPIPMTMSAGHVAFALKQAKLYSMLERACKERYKQCGIDVLCEAAESPNSSLAVRVERWRAREALKLPDVKSKRPPFLDPTISSSAVKLPEPDADDENVEEVVVLAERSH